ncbi:MAG: GNAT family N-acetyltransferase, partial [Desulfobacteraceae bacterium]|nr:GNAT family N-acetyltransferase [Desulfobacteraceae bacterium]
QYEKKEYTTTGKKYFIRPIRPSDADLLIAHFHSLSEKSIYMRFFSPLKQLSKALLIKLTQIDYDREIALVALMGKGPEKKITGVCRIILEPDQTRAEFAIVISDGWQGEGIGYSLLKQCLKAAEAMGVKQVIGIVLTENTQMKKLGKKLGFSVTHVQNAGEYELIIDFNKK